MDFYLVDTFGASEAKADFVVSPNSSYNDHRLTNNNLVNLFRNQAPH
jgi:hypothetical protein